MELITPVDHVINPTKKKKKVSKIIHFICVLQTTARADMSPSFKFYELLVISREADGVRDPVAMGVEARADSDTQGAHWTTYVQIEI